MHHLLHSTVLKCVPLIDFNSSPPHRRYIYGFEIDFELADLYDSYLAADKYLLYRFDRAFFDYVKARLDPESSCLIYDQLIKIGEREEISLAHVRTVTIENSRATFDSEHFTHVDQETLISLLSLDELSIDENELLVAVSKWVDCEVQRRGLPVSGENRRKVFEPIKSYVQFASLSPEKIADYEEVAGLLTAEELAQLFLHLLNRRNPLTIELKTSRRAGAARVFITDLVSAADNPYSNQVYLSVNRKVFIRAIYTTYCGSEADLSLKILDSGGLDFGLESRVSLKNDKSGRPVWCFSFDKPFEVQANIRYRLQVLGQGKATREDQMSRQQQLNYTESVTCVLRPVFLFEDYHCIGGLEFCSLDSAY